MAGVVAMRAMFERMGFTNTAAILLTDEQGIDTLLEVRNLKDANIENLCKVLRRPGGQNTSGNPDPGVKVSIRAEENLKLASYYCRHQERVSRPTSIPSITLSEVRKLSKQRDLEKVKSTDTRQPPTVNLKDWPRTMEAIEEYLQQFRGTTGVPLSYVIRHAIQPPSDASDPSTNYPTIEHEMIARAPILAPGATGDVTTLETNGPFTQSFITDRSEVWSKLAVIFGNLECWTYAKVARRTRDGRKCFRSVYNHYLGPNNIDHMASKAERKLRDSTYHGEKRNWNFEKYVTTHKEQHHVLLSLESHGYKGVDERSKVRYLNDGIKTSRLDTVKATILSSSEYRSNFDKCVNLYKDFIEQANGQLESNVSAVKTGTTNSRPTGTVGTSEITDRYYTVKEYRTLSPEQKKKLHELRKKRKSGSGNSKVASVEANHKNSEGQSEPDKEGNRNHPALTRQKKRAKS